MAVEATTERRVFDMLAAEVVGCDELRAELRELADEAFTEARDAFESGRDGHGSIYLGFASFVDEIAEGRPAGEGS